jgi:DNA-binding cell septation regulator SpoVG
VLQRQARRVIAQYLTKDALTKINGEIATQATAVALPDDLAERFKTLLEERPELPWDLSVAHIMKILRLTPVSTGGSILAYLELETPNGFVLRKAKLNARPRGDLWIAMPSQRRLDRNGNPIIGDKGKPLYTEFVGFRDRETRDRFTAAVIEAVRRQHPHLAR